MFKWKTNLGSVIWLIKVGITNCYLIDSKGIIILVDTGQEKQSKKLKTALNNILEGRDLNYLILTHTHYDHAENAQMVKELYNPKLIVHKSEAEFLRLGFTKLPKGTNFITALISSSGNKYASWIGKYKPVHEDIRLDDNFNMGSSENIQIIHTPGHTVGSVSVIIDDEIAIVGDTLFGIFKKKVLPPFADEVNELYNSWKKLLETPCKRFLPAHGKIISRQRLTQYVKN